MKIIVKVMVLTILFFSMAINCLPTINLKNKQDVESTKVKKKKKYKKKHIC